MLNEIQKLALEIDKMHREVAAELVKATITELKWRHFLLSQSQARGDKSHSLTVMGNDPPPLGSDSEDDGMCKECGDSGDCPKCFSRAESFAD